MLVYSFTLAVPFPPRTRANFEGAKKTHPTSHIITLSMSLAHGDTNLSVWYNAFWFNFSINAPGEFRGRKIDSDITEL